MWITFSNLISESRLKTTFTYQIQKSYPHLRCYDFSLRYISFLAFALDNSNCFYSWLSRGYYERGQSICILRKFETSAR